MDNVERRKEYKRLWYHREQAKKRGDWVKYYQCEDQMDDIRIYKKHDPKYTAKIKQHKQDLYNKLLSNGYFAKRAREYRNQHPDKYKKASKKRYNKLRKTSKGRKKLKEFNKKSYQKNKERIRAHQAKYYRTHKKKIQKYGRNYSKFYYHTTKGKVNGK